MGREYDNSAQGMMLGFMVGMAAGLAAGVLYAPRSGKETRDKITSSARTAGQKTSAALREGGRAAKETS